MRFLLVREQEQRFLNLTLIVGIICLVLETLFVLLGIRIESFPVFLVVFFLIAYIPGRLLIRWLKLSLSPLERFTLELGSGYVGTTLVYFILRGLNLELIYFFLIAVFSAYYFYGLTCNEEPWPAIELKIDRFSIWFLVVFLLIIGNVGWLNFSTWVINSDGYLLLNGLYDWDNIFHVSLVHELANSFLPHYSYAGNFPLVYHFFPDLFAAFFVRWANLPPQDLVVRFLPLFHFTLLFLSSFILMRKLSGNKWVSLFAVFLLVFMGNMGFIIFGAKAPVRYFEYAFIPHQMILNINPLLIGIAIMMLGLFVSADYLQTRRFKSLGLAAFFLGMVTFYKVFTILPIILGIFVPALILWWKKKDFGLILLGLVTGSIASLGIAFFWYISPYSGNFIEFNPLFLVSFSLVAPPFPFLYGIMRPVLDLGSNLSKFQQYTEYYQLMFGGSFSDFFLYFVWYGLVFLLGSMWLRVFGLAGWLRDLFAVTSRPLQAVFSWIILSGLLIALLFTVPPEDYNVVAFMALSLYLLSYYASFAVIRFLENKAKFIQLFLITLFIVMSIPNTLNLYSAKPDGQIPPPLVNLGEFINQNTTKGSIIAYPLGSNIYYVLLPALGGVRSFSEQVFLIENLIGQQSADKLRYANRLIYQTTVREELIRIIDSNNIEYVLEDRMAKIRVPKEKILKEVYSADGYVLNQVIHARN